MLNKNNLIHQGNLFFKLRGFLPVIIIVISICIIFYFPVNYNQSFQVVFYSCAFILIILGHFIRATTVGKRYKHSSGRNRSHHFADRLNKTGWYSMTRNPLYFANFCIWIGISLLTFNLLILSITILFFWFMYRPIILSEENYLTLKFGDDYISWAENTSTFFPNFLKYQKNKTPISFRTILKNEYPGMSATLTCIFIVELIKGISFNQEYLFQTWHVYYLFSIAFFSISMKWIKHKTKLFYDED